MSSLYSYFGSRPIPARIGTRRHHIVVRSGFRPLARMSFSSPHEKPSEHSRGHVSNLLEAFRLAISFRRSLFGHGNNHAERNATCLTPNVSNPTHRVTGIT